MSVGVDTVRFLQGVAGDIPPAAALVLFARQTKAIGRFADAEQAAGWALARAAESQCVYVGRALQPLDLPPGKRGGNDSAVSCRSIYLDVDIAAQGKNGPPDVETAVSFVRQLPVPATWIVGTGHGIQAWWLFKEPLDLHDDGERDLYWRTANGWQRLAQNQANRRGWRLDSVADFARVGRVPGTVNYKAAPVPVMFLADDGSEVDVGEFAGYVGGAEHIRAEREAADARNAELNFTVNVDAEIQPERVALMREAHPRFGEIWDKRCRFPSGKDSASEYDFAMISLLLKNLYPENITIQEVVDYVVAARRARGEDPAKLYRPADSHKHLRDAICRVLGEMESGATVSALRDAHRAVADAANRGETPSDDRRALILERLSDHFKMQIYSVQMFRHADGAAFRINTERLVPVEIPSADALLRSQSVSAAFAVATRETVACPPAEEGGWRVIAQALLDVADEVTVADEMAPDAVDTDTFIEYMRKNKPYDEENIAAAVMQNRPFVAGGKVFFRLRHYVKWMQSPRGGGDREAKDRVVARRLKDRGFMSAVYPVRGDRPTTISVWSPPDDVAERARALIAADSAAYR